MHARDACLFAVLVPILLFASASASSALAGASASITHPGAECELPEALAGTTGHVLYRYMLSRQEEAKQIKALWLTVEPESVREAFLEATRSCVERRAASGKSPDPLGSVRYLAFHFVTKPPEGAERLQIGPTRSVPLAWVGEMQDQKRALAEQILSEPVLREHSADGVRLLSNAGATAFKEISEGIDYTLRAFNEAFPGARPVPEGRGLTLLVFRDTEGYEQLAAFDALGSRGIVGTPRYQPWDRIVYAAAPHDRPYKWMAGLLARDLARHLVIQRLAPEGKDLPYWIVEGLSAFFQCLKWTWEERIDFTAVERQIEIRGFYKYRQPGAVMLEILGGSRPSFLTLPRVYPPGIGPERIERLDAPSWIAVHYLISGDGGAHRKTFQQWLTDPANEKTAESLAIALNRLLPTLDEGLHEHIKKTW